MPEIKHNFTSGKMNKDLDERLVPNGEYRDAVNIQVSTSEGSDVGTVQNILGNRKFDLDVTWAAGYPLDLSDGNVKPCCVGSVADEKNDTIYWFVHTPSVDYILRKNVRSTSKTQFVFVDTKASTEDAVLKFNNNGEYVVDADNPFPRLITGINIIDDMLFWTDDYSEPKKINITRSIQGTSQNATALVHTKLINFDVNINTITNVTDVKEEHITVIKKAPTTPLSMQFNYEAGRDPDLNYAAVVSVTEDPGTTLNTSSLFIPQTQDDDYDFSSYSVGDIVYLWIESDLNGDPDFFDDSINTPPQSTSHPGMDKSLQWQIGDKIVLKEFKNNIAPATPIVDYRIKGTIVAWNVGGSNFNTFQQNTSDPNYGLNYVNVSTWGAGRAKIALQIDSINGFPPVAPAGLGAMRLRYVIDKFDDNKKIFEFKFPRFSFRYKYEDGEYSTFAPWSQIAFKPSAFDHHPKKGYNIGMTNRLQDLLVTGFKPADIPKDVVEVDILYKEEGSTTIYVVETINPKDTVTSASTAGFNNNWDYGSYLITSETIKGAVPSNQFIRPWDNVPRKALAQDVTGNRIVYANYLQNYDLDSAGGNFDPDISVSLVQYGNTIPNPMKSIKSLREYQLGVVFLDEYGRETPVLSNSTGTIKLPKETSLTGNKFGVTFSGSYPNMNYFKFYVKEAAGEYYNMAMDRFYDAEDGNIWLAFPSSDRNKIDIDTFLILKKGVERDNWVPDPARYKVLAIESEAPDHIKMSKLLISEQTHTTTGANPKHIFEHDNMDTAPEIGGDEFEIFYAPFAKSSGGNLDKLIQPGVELWVEFTMSAEDEVSNRYKITQVTTDYEGPGGSVGINTARYYIKIDKQFGADTNFITDDPSGFASTKINDTAQIRFYKYEVENNPKFDGRFFVKIYSDGIFKQYVKHLYIDENQYKITAKREVYSLHEDMHNPTFMGGSVQTFGTWVDKTTDGGNALPWAQNGMPLFNPDASDFAAQVGYTWSGSSQWDYMWIYDQFDYNDFWDEGGTGAAPNWGTGLFQGRDPNRDDGFWRKMEFCMWMQDGAWEFLDNTSNLGAGISNGIWTDQAGQHVCYDTSNPSACGDNYLWHGQPLPEKPDREVDKWFIDSGKRRAQLKLGYGDDLEYSYPGSYNGTSGVPPGGWANNGLTSIPASGDDPARTRMELSFGPIWGESGGTSWPKIDFFRLGSFSPEYGHEADFVNKIKPGAQFRWKEDPTQTIYTIQANVEERNQIRWGSPAAGGANDEIRQKSGFLASNFTKRYRLQIEPDMDPIWNPFKSPYEPIANGLDITLPILSNGTSIISQKEDLDDAYITMSSIIGTDSNTGLEAQIMRGMIITHFDSDGNGSTETTLKSNNYTKQYLLIDSIDYDIVAQVYKLYIVGYSWPLTVDDTNAFTAAATRNVRFQQASVNHVSPEWCTNWNRVMRGGSFSQAWDKPTLGSVGYQLEFVEPIENEEILPDYPAIWETEPKEQVGLDIYYEVGGSNPTWMDKDTIKTAIPVGSQIMRPKSWQTTNYWPFPHLTVVNHRENVSDTVVPGNTLIELDGEVTAPAGSNYFSIGWESVGPSANEVNIMRPDGTLFGPVNIRVLRDVNYPSTGSGLSAIEFYDQDLYNGMSYELNYFNCYSYANGVESNRIRDNFNLPFISNGVKASTTAGEQYKEERRKSGLIYSGLYNSTTGINNLNQFITAEKITKDINPIYGSIQKLHSRDADLVTLCEDKILKILANKDAVYNADGNPQLIATPNVLGQTVPFTGEYGISKNPESFASESYRAYFTDTQRGVVLRLSMDGLTPISDYGMKDWFRDNLALKPGDTFDNYEINFNEGGSRLIGSYDARNDEYNIKLAYRSEKLSSGYVAKVVSFREDAKGWISFKSFIEKESGLSVSNKYITFSEGMPWEHYVEDVDRNTFYDKFEESSFKVLLNDNPSSVKSYNTLNYEGSQSKVNQFIEYTDSSGNIHTDKDYYNLQAKDGWYVPYIKTDLQDGGIPEFIDKENKWFNYITGTEIDTNETGLITSVINESEFSFQGLGTVASSSVVATVYGCTDINYLEYNPSATVDDGSCATLANLGCTDPNALNYDPLANQDDGSCQIQGCMDPLAFNYDPLANVPDPSSCIPVISGCNQANVITGLGASPDTDGLCANGVDITINPPLNLVPGYPYANACFVYGNHPGYDVANYTTNVNTPTSCDALPNGCIDPNASNYDANALISDGSCQYIGCTDPAAINYDPFAITDDGSCCSQQGCQDPAAVNWDPNNCLPCIDDNGVTNGFGGNCCVGCAYGCMQPNDTNYDPNATCSDPNMCAGTGGCTDPTATNPQTGATFLNDACVFAGCLESNNDAYYGDDCTTLINITGSTSTTFDNNGAGCIIPNYALAHSYDSSSGWTAVTPSYTAQALLFHDSSTCIYYGCTLTQDANGNAAANYDPNANTPCNATNDGAGNNDCCVFTILGCTDSTAYNYDPNANTDDGSCVPVILGCTDPTATNYNPNANTDDGSCVVPVLGCTDSSIGLWNDISGNNRWTGTPDYGPCSDPVITVDPVTGSASYSGGCKDIPAGTNLWQASGFMAKNYNPNATQDDGSCQYETGCTDFGFYNTMIDTNDSYIGGLNQLYGVSSGNANDCIPVIQGCLYSQYTADNGQVQYNYNVNSGPYQVATNNPSNPWSVNPFNTQHWSQSPVTRSGDPHFDVNTHNPDACIPCDTPSCDKPAGCIGYVGNSGTMTFYPGSPQNYQINYQYGDGNNISTGTGYAVGPFNLNTSQPTPYTVTSGGAGQYLDFTVDFGAFGGITTVPFNYDEQWVDTYEDAGVSLTYDDAGLSTDISSYGGDFEWDVSNLNACCNMAGCAHPYALNFDVKGWKKSPNFNAAGPAHLNMPVYVGKGLPDYDPSEDTGRACRTCAVPSAGGALAEGGNLSRYFKETNVNGIGVYEVNEDGYPNGAPADPLTPNNVYNTVQSSNISKWKMSREIWSCCHFENDTNNVFWGNSGNGIVGCTHPPISQGGTSCTVQNPFGAWNVNNYRNYNQNAVFDNGSCCMPNWQAGGTACGHCTESGGVELPDDSVIK